MTEQLELVLLVAFVVSVTGLLITGMVRLALRPAKPRSARPADGHGAQGLRRTERTLLGSGAA